MLALASNRQFLLKFRNISVRSILYATLTFSIGTIKLSSFGLCACWPVLLTPAAPTPPPLPLRCCPAACLSRSSTSSRRIALFSGTFMFRLFPWSCWCVAVVAMDVADGDKYSSFLSYWLSGKEEKKNVLFFLVCCYFCSNMKLHTFITPIIIRIVDFIVDGGAALARKAYASALYNKNRSQCSTSTY